MSSLISKMEKVSKSLDELYGVDVQNPIVLITNIQRLTRGELGSPVTEFL